MLPQTCLYVNIIEVFFFQIKFSLPKKKKKNTMIRATFCLIAKVHVYFDYILLIIYVTLNKLFNHHLASSAMELET